MNNMNVNNNSKPCGKNDLNRFENHLLNKIPFTYVRFSDGEIELLRNRKLSIDMGITTFRGRKFSNQFPDFDKKYFDPFSDQEIRKDLLNSAIFKAPYYFKGIPTSHNNAIIDREFMLRLNGGFDQQMTFSDLFMNSNYQRARNHLFPLVAQLFKNIFVVGNWRCKLCGYLGTAQLIKIPDNFFGNSLYIKTLNEVMNQLKNAPKYSIILSSASSLSNVIGHKLYLIRQDITFLDVGTAIHDLMGLQLGTRAYHKLVNSQTLQKKFNAWLYSQTKEFKIEW